MKQRPSRPRLTFFPYPSLIPRPADLYELSMIQDRSDWHARPQPDWQPTPLHLIYPPEAVQWKEIAEIRHLITQLERVYRLHPHEYRLRNDLCAAVRRESLLYDEYVHGLR